MMLSVRTYKLRKTDCQPEYKTYRYPCFDTAIEFEGLEFEIKFNRAFDVLKEEIQQDKNNNDMTKYDSIQICDVFLS